MIPILSSIRETLRSFRGGWWRALACVAVLNVVFLAAALVAAAIPRDVFQERVRDAFAAGELTSQDWLAFDLRRGQHQYDECLIFQMLTNEAGAVVPAALGPRLYAPDAEYADICATLQAVVADGAAAERFVTSRYTRYWHGYVPIAAAFLGVMDLATARLVLLLLSFAAVLALLVISITVFRGLARALGVCVAGAALTVWALPYFGQSFAHAPGDILLILALPAVLWAAGGAWSPRAFLVLCAGFGALVAYFEFLTGQIPTAAALLFAGAYAARREAAATGARFPGRQPRPREAWAFAVCGLAAMGIGGVLTVGIKQGLALAVLGPEVLEAFRGNLQLYMSAPDAAQVPQPFAELARRLDILTYGKAKAAYLLCGIVAAGWVGALGLMLRSGRRPAPGTSLRMSDYAAFAAATGIVFVWILILPTHTAIHAHFMIRMAIVPVALGGTVVTVALVGARGWLPVAQWMHDAYVVVASGATGRLRRPS